MVRQVILAGLICILPAVAQADVRELSQAELRNAVSRDQTIATRHLISGVESFTGGDVVEIRAFVADNKVTYRIMVRQPRGQLGLLMVDGATGLQVFDSSALGQEIEAYASRTPNPTTQLSSNSSIPGVVANNAGGNLNGNGNGNGRGGGNNGNGAGNSSSNNGNGGGNNGNGGGNGGGKK